MRAAGAALLGLALLAAPAAAQEVQLTAGRPGTAQPLLLWASWAENSWTIRVTDDAGRERQRFTVQGEATEALPRIADADGDGAGDLWVPSMTGNANTVWTIWTMQPREGRFRAAGEVAGLEFARDPGGWLVAQARDGCCTLNLVFYSFPRGGGALREAFTIGRQIREDGAPGRCAGTRGAPQDVVRPWCNAAPESWPPGVLPLR